MYLKTVFVFFTNVNSISKILISQINEKSKSLRLSVIHEVYLYPVTFLQLKFKKLLKYDDNK